MVARSSSWPIRGKSPRHAPQMFLVENDDVVDVLGDQGGPPCKQRPDDVPQGCHPHHPPAGSRTGVF